MDDHPLIREALALLVASLPGGASIFTAGSAAEALEQAELHAPIDAVLLDCSLPDTDGEHLIEALRWRTQGAVVIVVSGNETENIASRVIKMGAAGFVPKSKASSQILHVMLQAMAKGSKPPIADAALSGPAAPNNATPRVLTARQLDILLMLDQGKTNKDIALTLGLSEKTVKNHITALFVALGAINRLQAVRHARSFKLLN